MISQKLKKVTFRDATLSTFEENSLHEVPLKNFYYWYFFLKARLIREH